jgi:hypothetical protein
LDCSEVDELDLDEDDWEDVVEVVAFGDGETEVLELEEVVVGWIVVCADCELLGDLPGLLVEACDVVC